MYRREAGKREKECSCVTMGRERENCFKYPSFSSHCPPGTFYFGQCAIFIGIPSWSLCD